ncbi:hypothetical protein ADUPG1_014339, partial [Aduncisulcus paluster]
MPRKVNPLGLPTDIIKCSCGRSWMGLSNFRAHQRKSHCSLLEFVIAKYSCSCGSTFYGFNSANRHASMNKSHRISFMGSIHQRDLSSIQDTLSEFIREHRRLLGYEYPQSLIPEEGTTFSHSPDPHEETPPAD